MQVKEICSYVRFSVLPKLFLLVSFVATTMVLNTATMAQYGNPQTESGFKPFGSFDNGDIDSVNLVNLQIDLHLPFGLAYPQRGKMSPVSYYLTYTANKVAVPYTTTYNCGQFTALVPGCTSTDSSVYVAMPGGTRNSAGLVVVSSNTLDQFGGGPGYVFTADGATHEIAESSSIGGSMTLDGSGFFLSNGIVNNGSGVSVTYYPTTYTDTNATPNIFTYAQDTIGRSLPEISGLNDAYSINGGQGWTVTPDHSGCTGQFPIVTAVNVSFPSVYNGTSTYKICYAEFYITGNTSIDYPDIGDCCHVSYIGVTQDQPVIQIQSIVLPNNTAYTFTYAGSATDANLTADETGDLMKIALPTGGSISYEWTTAIYPPGTGGNNSVVWYAPGGSGNYVPYDTHRLKSRTIDDGKGHRSKWYYDFAFDPGYSAGSGWPIDPGSSGWTGSGTEDFPFQTIVTDPLGNDTVHTFMDVDTGDGAAQYYETATRYYQGPNTSGTLVKTIHTSYSYDRWQLVSAIYGPFNRAHAINVFPQTITTVYSDGSGIQKKFEYDQNQGYVLNDYEGNPAPSLGKGKIGNVTKETDIDFATNSTISITNNVYKSDQSGDGCVDSSYVTAWLMHLMCYSQTYSGSDSVSEMRYSYDPAGNLTTTNRTVDYIGGATLPWVTHYTGYGMPDWTTDPANNKTITQYDDSNLYPKEIDRPTTANGVTHNDYYAYDHNTSQLLSHVDENGSGILDSAHLTTYDYHGDLLGRLKSIRYPPTQSGQGQVRLDYDDSALTVTSTTAASPDPPVTTKTSYDGLGRAIQTTRADDATSETTYNGVGQVESVSNPHLGTPSTTDGVTTYFYDALGRTRYLCNPDTAGPTQDNPCPSNNSYREWAYSGATTTFYDEERHQWQQEFDALGRLTKVTEPGSLVTKYGYNKLGNLTSVDQLGNTSSDTARTTRSFSYDLLSRLTSASNPETGTTTYDYGTNGLCAGDVTLPCSKTDTSRTTSVKTTYKYDYLNRLYSKTFDDGTFSSCYAFDSGLGSSVVNSKGHQVAEWTQSGPCPSNSSTLPGNVVTWKKVDAYDAMGRVTLEEQCALAPCSNPTQLPYVYNVAGNVIGFTGGNQYLLANTFDSAGRLAKVTSNYSDWTMPGTLFEADSSINGIQPYGPLGLTAAQYGVNTFQLRTALIQTRAYDSRGRITDITVNGGQAPGGAGGISPITMYPSPIPQGETALLNLSCDESCGSGSLQLLIDDAYSGGGTYSPNVPISFVVTPYVQNDPANPTYPPGRHHLQVLLSGDSTHPAAASSVVQFDIVANSLPTPSINVSFPQHQISSGQWGEVDIAIGCGPSCATGHWLIDGNYAGGFYPDSSGNAVVYVAPNVPKGHHTLTVQYWGDPNYREATSDFGFDVVDPGISPITFTPSPVAQGVTAHAQISCTGTECGSNLRIDLDGGWYGGSGYTPGQMIDLLIYPRPNNDPNNPLLAQGSHTLQISFGDDTHPLISSELLSFQIVENTLPKPPLTAIINPNPIPTGEYGQITIDIGCHSACGIGNYSIDGVVAGGFQVDGTGTVPVYTRNDLAPGAHQLTIQYFGNGSYSNVTTDPIGFIVQDYHLITPNITISLTDPATASAGLQGSFHMDCNSACGTGFVAAGNGYVMVDGNYEGGFVVDSNGNVSGVWPLSALSPKQLHTFTVHYNGNTTYAPTEASATFQITQ